MKRIYSSFVFFLLFSGLILGTAVDASAMKKKAMKMKSIDVPIHMLTTENVSGLGTIVGTVTIMETPEGLVFKPVLKGLPAGEHGFHLHENMNLGPKKMDGKLVAGLQAGGHYDPTKTKMHLGPYNPKGHLGDLPLLFVDQKGMTPFAVLAPRIKTLDEIYGRAIMIHFMGDNYSDMPKTLGGGGARLAGGLIKK